MTTSFPAVAAIQVVPLLVLNAVLSLFMGDSARTATYEGQKAFIIRLLSRSIEKWSNHRSRPPFQAYIRRW